MSIFLGRQPILDRKRRTYGYELLYRDSDIERADFDDPDDATKCVVEYAMLEWGLKNIVGDSLAFINVTADFLRSELYHALPADRVVLELLESVDFGPETVRAIRLANKAGFRVALDDLVTMDTPGLASILPMVDIVKIEVLNLGHDELADLVRTLRRDAPQAKLLAEKVETVEIFDHCRELGFDLFQGFFFAKPAVLHRAARPTSRYAALMLLVAVQDPDITITELADLANGDPTLAYRLLKLVNSSWSGVPRTVQSVRQAIVLLGIEYVRQLATLLTIASYSESNQELITLSATRARAAEHLIRDPRLRDCAFTAGLLSVIDAVFQTPMDELVDDLPLPDLVREALLAATGPIGEVLTILRAYEHADLVELERLRPGGLDEIREAFDAATHSADELRRQLSGMSSR